MLPSFSEWLVEHCHFPFWSQQVRFCHHKDVRKIPRSCQVLLDSQISPLSTLLNSRTTVRAEQSKLPS